MPLPSDAARPEREFRKTWTAGGSPESANVSSLQIPVSRRRRAGGPTENVAVGAVLDVRSASRHLEAATAGRIGAAASRVEAISARTASTKVPTAPASTASIATAT